MRISFSGEPNYSGYESGDKTTVTDSIYRKLQKALDDCHAILGTERDLRADADLPAEEPA